MMPSLGTAGWWFISANTLLAVALWAWGRFGRYGAISLALAALVAATLYGEGYRRASKAGEVLGFMVCGGPIYHPVTRELVGFRFHTDLDNKNDDRITFKETKRSLFFGGGTTQAPLEGESSAVPIDPKSVERIENNFYFARPIRPTSPDTKGEVHLEFSYGPGATTEGKTLVVYGAINVPFSADGIPSGPMSFREYPESTPALEDYCDKNGTDDRRPTKTF